MDIAVEIQNLNKSYDKRPILRNLSFSIRKGEIFGLLGPNGAGKTTTLSITTLLPKLLSISTVRL